MAILQYPGLDQVENEGTKAALRLIWDEIRSLDDREEVSEGLTATELDQIQTALQLGGSNQLNVSGLLGKLQGIQKSMTSVHGHWTKTTNSAGAGAFDWDTPLLESVPGAFRRTNSNTELRFMVAGTYLIVARLWMRGHASGARIREFVNVPVTGAPYIEWGNDNATNVGAWYTGEIVDMLRVVPGDYVLFASTFATRGGWAGIPYVSLYAVRLI